MIEQGGEGVAPRCEWDEVQEEGKSVYISWCELEKDSIDFVTDFDRRAMNLSDGWTGACNGAEVNYAN